MLKRLKQFIKNTFIIPRRKARELENVLDSFGLKGAERAAIKADIKKTQAELGFSPIEFMKHHFMDVPQEIRRTFVSDNERIAITDRLNRSENKEIFDNKALTYKTFRQFYKRDQFYGNPNKALQSLDEFKTFVAKHPRFIAKPLNSAFGKGVRILELDGTPDAFLTQLQQDYPYGYVLEELIRQCKEMASLHPESVNTLRVLTLRFDDHVQIVHPFLRVGRGKSVVDNGMSGGILCTVDPATGVVKNTADERGIHYVEIPETGVKLVGFQIPRWQEALELAKQLAQVIPSNRWTGWDLALTDDGWIMVEGNARAQFGFQIADRTGFRAEIESYMKELNL